MAHSYSDLRKLRDDIERPLVNGLIYEALPNLRRWAMESDYERYDDRLRSIEDNYNYIFQHYLAGDDPEHDALIDNLIRQALIILDELYVDLLYKYDLLPATEHYDPQTPLTYAHYFNYCLRPTDEDKQVIRDILSDPQPSMLAMCVSSGVAECLDIVWNEELMLMLIEAIENPNDQISFQCMSLVLGLLIDYDDRIDFFHNVQQTFWDKVQDDLSRPMIFLRMMVESVEEFEHKTLSQDMQAKIYEELPDEVRQMLREKNADNPRQALSDMLNEQSAYKASEEHMRRVQNLPGTWLYEAVVGSDEEQLRDMEMRYLKSGSMELMWHRLDEAEQMLKQRLRKRMATQHPTDAQKRLIAIDLMNYGHCCYVNGDRAMAYENYRQAIAWIGEVREFFERFHEDRPHLIEAGLTENQLFLMEDHLIRYGMQVEKKTEAKKPLPNRRQ